MFLTATSSFTRRSEQSVHCIREMLSRDRLDRPAFIQRRLQYSERDVGLSYQHASYKLIQAVKRRPGDVCEAVFCSDKVFETRWPAH